MDEHSADEILVQHPANDNAVDDRIRCLRQRIWNGSTPEPNTGCWLWMKCRNPDGYGQMSVGNRAVGAHRISYEAFVNPIPAGIFVLHRCDTPACVNPSHLFLGTQIDNVRDREEKGRTSAGARHSASLPPETRVRGAMQRFAKLSDEKVMEIRLRHRAGESIASIARAFGVAAPNVSLIISGKRWKHVPVESVVGRTG